MGEGGVADDGHRGPNPTECGAVGHGDGRAHLHAGGEGPERRQPAEGVAAYVAEGLAGGGVLHDCVDGGEQVPVAAAHAECRRTGCRNIGFGAAFPGGQAEGLPDRIRGEFSRAGETAVESAADLVVVRQDALQALFQQGLAFLEHQDLLALHGEFQDEFLGVGVLRYLEHGMRAAVREVLLQIVVGYAAGDDSEALVGAILEAVEAGTDCILFEDRIVFCELGVTFAGVYRQGAPLHFVLREMHLVGGAGFVVIHAGDVGA